MIRVMLMLIIAILTTCGFTSEFLSVQQVVINGQIHLDDVSKFNFGRLSVFIQHSKQKNGPWSSIGPIVPDEKGAFITSVPAESWVTIDVNTSDPTIQLLLDPTDNFGFYSLRRGEKVTVFYQRLQTPSSSTDKVEWKVELQRGAALSICMLDKMKSGAIYFRNLDGKNADVIHMVSFTDLTTLKGGFIGGLIPGNYEVMYIDDNDVKWMVQKVSLSRGEVSHVKCE
jgi:hypothetical protein